MILRHPKFTWIFFVAATTAALPAAGQAQETTAAADTKPVTTEPSATDSPAADSPTPPGPDTAAQSPSTEVAPSPAPDTSVAATVVAPDYLLSVTLAFGHWMGFGRPDGYQTPAFSLGVLAFSFLEVRARYTFSVEALPLATGASSRVGFVSVEGLLRRELFSGREILTVFAGPLALMGHASGVAPGWGFGTAFGLEYLFSIPSAVVRAIGITVVTRGLLLTPPGESGKLDLFKSRRDVHVDLGVVARLF